FLDRPALLSTHFLVSGSTPVTTMAGKGTPDSTLASSRCWPSTTSPFQSTIIVDRYSNFPALKVSTRFFKCRVRTGRLLVLPFNRRPATSGVIIQTSIKSYLGSSIVFLLL